MTNNIGMITLAVFLILQALVYFGVAIPAYHPGYCSNSGGGIYPGRAMNSTAQAKQPQVELDFDIDFWQSSYEYLEAKRPSLITAMTRLIANGATAEEVKRRAKQRTSNAEYLRAIYNAALYIQARA